MTHNGWNCMPPRRMAPVWMMGLTNAVFGMYGGIIVISVPQLLSARHMPEATIAAMTAVMISPAFWSFLASPVLDVRFSRRAYSVATAVSASALLVAALFNLDHPVVFEALLVTGFFSASLYQSALGGWLSSITPAEQQNRLSVWVTIGNLGGGGLMALATGELVRNASVGMAAALLGGAVLLPLTVFPWMPAPGPDRRLARDSFRQFFREVVSLLARRQVLIAILLFLAPAATFSLTNFLSGIGNDFHASPHFVGMVGGAGVFAGGVAGCLCFHLIDRVLPLRLLYLAIGAVGAIFTFCLILLAPTPAAFAIALIGENIFQGLAITASIAISFQTIGPGNPLAATTFCVMNSAFNVPITYMLFVDGFAYARGGVAGSYTADASLSLLACVSLGALVVWLSRNKKNHPPA